MKKLNGFTQFQSLVTSAQVISILLPEELTYDKTAAGVSLFLILQKMGKKVNIFSSKLPVAEFSSLVGVDKIKNKLEGKNLVISFKKELIEKISYNENEESLDLIIVPKENYTVSPQDFKYSYRGNDADLFLIVGAVSLEELGRIYLENKDEINEEKLFIFDLESFQVDSWSLLMALLIKELKLSLDGDIASNLLRGIEEATDGFSPVFTSPLIFEMAAFCLRSGGQRLQRKSFNKKPTKGFFPQEVSKKQNNKNQEYPSPDWFAPKIYKGNTTI